MQKSLLKCSCLFILCLSFIVFRQPVYGQSLERVLLAAGGKVSAVNQLELNYSIGELAVATLQATGSTGTAFICTEGFQQKLITDIKDVDLRTAWYSRLRVEAYPNPVRTNLTVYVYDDNFDEYRVDLYDAADRRLQQYTLQKNKLIIPMQQYPAGFYWLKFFNTRRQEDGSYKKFKPYKIIKVN